jgi:hypothetical protein
VVDDVLKFIKELQLPVCFPTRKVCISSPDINCMKYIDLVSSKSLASALVELSPLTIVARPATPITFPQPQRAGKRVLTKQTPVGKAPMRPCSLG